MGDVPAGCLFLLHFLFLQVHWKGNMRYSVISKGRSARQVCDVLHMGRPHNALVEHGDIHKKLVERNVLLRESADEIVKLKPGNGKHRLVVKFGIIESIQQVNPARPGSGEANAELAGELCITARHESSGLFMPHLDKSNLVLASAKRFHDSIDSVARKPENDFYSPVQQSFN